MLKVRLGAIFLLILGAWIAWFVYSSEIDPNSKYHFKLGLDLDSGTHLTYIADTSALAEGDIAGAMDSLRQTVERRINIFGVSEPIVQVEKGGAFSHEDNTDRLIVELPGITEVSEAIKAIGKTPLLEFKLMTDDPALLELAFRATTEEELLALQDQLYVDTGLTGTQLKRASLVFDNVSGAPLVTVDFNKEGKELLFELTDQNIGRIMAIFLDDTIVSAPVIRDSIRNGTAQITGDFTPEEGKLLVQDLNFGALPVAITLAETQTIGASLGQETLDKGIDALLWGFALVFIFLILYYRLPGIVATVALMMYLAIMLALFKIIPVTLTASGLTGFILSIGMAVDANVLIFERLKEELAEGSNIYEAVKESTRRAWSSIRDGNFSSLIAATVLYWMSGTSLVKGFALVFGMGVLTSMFTAIVVSRTLLLALSNKRLGSRMEVMFNKK